MTRINSNSDSEKQAHNNRTSEALRAEVFTKTRGGALD